MYHTAAYKATITSATLADVAALTDNVLTISNNHFRIVNPMQLMAVMAMSNTVTEVQITSPSIRIVAPLDIMPLGASSITLSPIPICDFTSSPFTLPVREEIQCLASGNAGGGGEVFTALIFLTPQYTAIPSGPIYWVKSTSTTAAVASTWTNISLTLAQSLPSGYYSVVGSIHQSATALAHRYIFPGQVWRPGQPSITAKTNLVWNGQQMGYLGEMGRFVNDNPFQIEVLAAGTDNSHTIYTGLVPVSSLGA